MTSRFNLRGWSYDFGAMVYIYNGISIFKIHEDVLDSFKMIMSNHDTAKIYGKRIADLQFIFGKKLKASTH